MVNQDELERAKGVILSGSYFSVHDKDSPRLNFDPIKLAQKGIGVLGLCYGEQLIAHHL